MKAIFGAEHKKISYFFYGCVAATIFSFGLLVFHWNLQNKTEKVAERIRKLEVAKSQVVYLDEVLSMSSRMAAFTGDLQWKARYLDHVEPLDLAISEIRLHLNDEAVFQEFASLTDVANQRLIGLEMQSFELVEDGRLQDAQALLLSTTYNGFKAQYSQGAEILDRAINHQLVHQKKYLQRIASWMDGLVILCFGILGVLGLFIFLIWRKSLHNQKLTNFAERFASVGMMTAGIGHEINNPIAVISYAVEELEKQRRLQSPDPLKVEKNINRISRASIRIQNIIKGLQKISRPDADMARVDRFTSHDLIDESKVYLEKRLEQNAVKWREDVEDLEIQGNFVQLSQVLVNLISNAIDQVSELPEPWVHVSVGYSQDQCRVRFAVTDSGKSQAKWLQEKLAMPFGSTKQVGSGMGLGLTICRTIVEAHQGTIYADPNSEFTRFIVELPRPAAPAVYHKL